MSSQKNLLEKWIPDEHISQVRRANFASYNAQSDGNAINDEKWVQNHINELRRDIVNEQLQRQALLGNKTPYGVQRAFLSKDGTKLLKKGVQYNVVNQDFYAFLLKYPAIMVEDIFPSK